ncbi:hypothetical protein A3J19_00090 [Candidatus Daviesbacteria bacterium RIFCSPLOWO2_02_FULL_41_8]|uniref:UPF0182 protein A3J19_00090 n=3 Tax=Candidatus Daviesiibacteriota TaxID=1752718 RepID=A0A1F5NM78_9BACT|nr:MAG: hypothetical protein A2871_03045 [Candidatus Daviesbacteria bacterium RIFCSPHIGHO2_01_FULL_41_23]OGE33667.1 MAG: hypothetical protein A3D83_00690 [Candidatus Daviesbacteria bacterium RIFCSPHIGHO2_02_FULL_41_10]OGE62023.1 MAG: hypothetical protein A2967_02860 [Candidatus Daviesbacteria bacterium RIFCSPLOWO2_01_FULL_41_32]OGE78653.1 MAG: hypothetical protein A3J19_00090 [Candidatus Daviesbacteria bacterium RIFCSPLOWO2_02_FULL_41_8]
MAFVTFIFFSVIVSLITDWWWYQEVGFTEIFVKSLTAKIIIFFSSGALVASFLLANLFFAIRSKIPWITKIPDALIGLGQPVHLNSRLIGKLGIIISFLIAAFVGLIAASSWHEVLKFLSAVSFGQIDPVFSRDVSFYIFSLPVFSLGLGLIKAAIIISLLGCGAIYFLRGKLNLSSFLRKIDLSKLTGKSQISLSASPGQADPKARLHLGILIFLLLATIAAGKYLSLFDLLISQSGPVFGASFTDANIMVPILYVSVIAYGLAALLALFYGISGKIAPLFGVIFLTFIIGFASMIIPPVFQKLIVAPNELTKETPFIKHNIELSRKAYGLDKVKELEIAANKPITAADIAANDLTIKNVRLWDRAPLLSTFSQIQEIRTYYEFTSVDNDRYTINDELRQIMLSPRELASDSLPNKNWINERLTFTHGYGVAAGPVNQVTPEGLPVLFVKDLPPQSEVKELSVERPEVYYGEIPNDYVIVKTKSKEFDYPKGDENVYTTYGGNGGVEINSLWKRIFYALRFGSLKIFLSGDITKESRILYYRNINERVLKIAPFLKLDRDPYLVIAEGKLYWILDAYTTTDNYPYSQQMPLNGGNVNYIRNSVKAVVSAYGGEIRFYQTDADDPIIKTYAKIFPKTFLPLSELPKSIAPHLRYPEDIFTLQTAIYTTYHMDDPQIFYNKEDQWEVPTIAQGGEAQIGGQASAMSPRHMIMKLPGEKIEEFILMLPFTPRSKDNLSAWMVARNDGDQYGKLVVYRFPKDKLVFGPKQIIGRISQDAQISQQISLWDQGGSQVIQGPLLVIPIEESLVYVRPLYLKAATGKIPELKRVIVAYENKIAMEETLEAGLARIFGTDEGQVKQSGEAPVSVSPDKTKEDLLLQASQAYQTAINAQREGNWGRYGEEIKKLGEVLSKLQQ